MAEYKRRKKWLFRGVTALVVFVILPAAAFLYVYFGVIPRGEIARLKDGYVATAYSGGQVHYEFVTEKPADWTLRKDLSEETCAAFLVCEDQRFYHHYGFDPFEVRYAIMEAIREGKRPRGASTIPQQIAKNLFLTPEYSVRRKLKEIAIAIYMDAVLPKSKLLEIYVNMVEYGEGLYGITEASEFYFEKQPADLAPKEAAYLAMLLPNPKKNSQSFRDKELSPETDENLAKVMTILCRLEYLTEEECARQIATPLFATDDGIP